MNNWFLRSNTITDLSPDALERSNIPFSVQRPPEPLSVSSRQSMASQKKRHRFFNLFKRPNMDEFVAKFKGFSLFKPQPASTEPASAPTVNSLSSFFPIRTRHVDIHNDTIPEMISTRTMSQRRNHSLRRSQDDSCSLVDEISNGSLRRNFFDRSRDVAPREPSIVSVRTSYALVQEEIVHSTTSPNWPLVPLDIVQMLSSESGPSSLLDDLQIIYQTFQNAEMGNFSDPVSACYSFSRTPKSMENIQGAS